MGFTTSQVLQHFNSIVNLYKAFDYIEVPCSNICYYGNTYRSINLVKNDDTVTLSLERESDQDNDLDYLNLDVKVFAKDDCKCKYHGNFYRFYKVGGDYFTLNENEAKSVAILKHNRFISYWDHRGKSLYLNINKMSAKLSAYLHKLVNTRLDDRSKDYVIRDVYFSYTECTRKLVVVIKHDDNNATEAFWFDPCIISMYFSKTVY